MNTIHYKIAFKRTFLSKTHTKLDGSLFFTQINH